MNKRTPEDHRAQAMAGEPPRHPRIESVAELVAEGAPPERIALRNMIVAELIRLETDPLASADTVERGPDGKVRAGVDGGDDSGPSANLGGLAVTFNGERP